MKNLSLVITLIFACLFFNNGHAAYGGAGSVVVTYHYFEGHPGLLVAQEVMTNPDSCERSDLYILRKEHLFYKELTALFMSAHLARQPLVVIVGGCFQGFPVIKNVVSNLP